MVAGRIVEGLPREIGEKISQMVGDRRVTVMLMDMPSEQNKTQPLSDAEFNQAMMELEAMAEEQARLVPGAHVDDSREAIYTRQDGE